MMVNCAVVLKIELAFGQRLARSRVGNFGLVSVQLVLIAQIEPVYENRRILVGVGIIDRIIHAVGA